MTGRAVGKWVCPAAPRFNFPDSLTPFCTWAAFPSEQIIELLNGAYINWGEPVASTVEREAQVEKWYAENQKISGSEVVGKFAEMGVVISLATAKRDLAKLKGQK